MKLLDLENPVWRHFRTGSIWALIAAIGNFSNAAGLMAGHNTGLAICQALIGCGILWVFVFWNRVYGPKP